MRRHWDEHELAERWSLTSDEFELVCNRTDHSRIGFAALLKFFQVEGRFPSENREVPMAALEHLANQLNVSRERFSEYALSGRSCERDRAQIRSLLGYRRATVDDGKQLSDWLSREVLPVDHNPEHLREAAFEWCLRNQIEPPTRSRTERILGSAVKAFETAFFEASYSQVPIESRVALDALLLVPEGEHGVRQRFAGIWAISPGRVG